MPTQPAGGMWPESALQECRVRVDSVNFELIGESPILRAFHQTLTYVHERDEQASWRLEYALSDVKLAPDFEESAFEIEMDVPEDTPVTVADAPGIEYRWQGGRPVRFVDRGTLPAAPTDEYRPRTGLRTSSLAILAGGLLILGVGGWLAYRRLKAGGH
jgi:LPXTG-motif cell wall-anchored protein